MSRRPLARPFPRRRTSPSRRGGRAGGRARGGFSRSSWCSWRARVAPRGDRSRRAGDGCPVVSLLGPGSSARLSHRCETAGKTTPADGGSRGGDRPGRAPGSPRCWTGPPCSEFTERRELVQPKSSGRSVTALASSTLLIFARPSVTRGRARGSGSQGEPDVDFSLAIPVTSAPDTRSLFRMFGFP
jgi:hypothetical protein